MYISFLNPITYPRHPPDRNPQNLTPENPARANYILPVVDSVHDASQRILVPTTGPGITLDETRKMLRKNFHGPEEVEECFGVHYDDDVRKALDGAILPRRFLETYRWSHILFPGFPLSLLDMRKTNIKHLFPEFLSVNFFERMPYANENVDPCWYLLRKEGRGGKDTLQEQSRSLSSNEQVPRACEAVSGMILHYVTSGERLFQKSRLRCRDRDSGTSHVLVGPFDDTGLWLYSVGDEEKTSEIELATTFKFSTDGSNLLPD